MSTGVEQLDALPEQCEELYSSGADAPIMNLADTNEVKRIIAESRRGFPLWAKESIGFAVVMAGAVWIIQTHIPAQIGSQTSSISADVAVLKSDVGAIKADVSEIRKDIKDQLVKALDAARQQMQKAPKGSLQERGALEFGKTVVAMAQTFKVIIDGPTLASFGQPIIANGFTSGSRNGPDARLTAIALLNYLSFLNIPMLPAIDPKIVYVGRGAEGLKNAGFTGARWLNRKPGSPMSARYDTIGSNHQYDPKGPDVFMVTGGEAELDNMHLENVVFRGVHIVYRGAPLDIRSVWFVNCTFDIGTGPRGQQFANSMLGSAPVSLRTS